MSSFVKYLGKIILRCSFKSFEDLIYAYKSFGSTSLQNNANRVKNTCVLNNPRNGNISKKKKLVFNREKRNQ